MRLLLPGMTFSGTFEPDGKGFYRIIGGVTKADGVLMVAAPELLTVARQLKRYAWANAPEKLPLELRAIINAACNAIAKAEGRANV